MAPYNISHLAITACLVLLVLGLCRAVRMRPAIQHALWLVIVLRFMLPTTMLPLPTIGLPETRSIWLNSALKDSVILKGLASQARAIERLFTRQAVGGEQPAAGGAESGQHVVEDPAGVAWQFHDESGARPAASVAGLANVAEQVTSGASVGAGPHAASTSPWNLAPAFWSWVRLSLLTGWWLGSIGVAGRVIWQIVSFQRTVAAAVPANQLLQSQADELARELGIASVPIVSTQGTRSPCVWCFGRLRICWPTHLSRVPSNDPHVRAMLTHELAHICRRDHWVAWLELLANIVWWWNPFYHVARHQLRLAAELACDQWVIARMPDDRRKYAEALISIGHSTELEFVPAFLGPSQFSKRNLQRRLTMIMTNRHRSARLGQGWMAALGVALVACLNWQLTTTAVTAVAETTQPERSERATVPSRERILAPTTVAQAPPPESAAPQSPAPAQTTAEPATPAQLAPSAQPSTSTQSPAAPQNPAKASASSLLSEVLEQVESHYYEPVDGGQISREVLAKVLQQLNPEAELFNANQFAEVLSQVNGSIVGIGIAIKGAPADDPVISVNDVLPNSPAKQAGIRVGDVIRRVDETKIGDLTAETRLSEAVRLIRGQAGSAVKLTLEREGTNEALVLDVKRGALELSTVLGYQEGEGADQYYADREHQVGYIRIANFSAATPTQFKAALQQLRQAGLKSLVLDLRYNGGGALDAVVEVADTLLDEGQIVKIVPRDSAAATTYEASKSTNEEAAEFERVPVVVLVNPWTASAAEVLAACLQDQQRAKIVGERTRGIGLVKSITPLSDGSALKLPVAAIVRPNGDRLQRAPQATPAETWGVQPDADCLVELTEAEQEQLSMQLNHSPRSAEADRVVDRQLQRALELVKPQS